MKEEGTIRFLQHQLELAFEREGELFEQVKQLSAQNSLLSERLTTFTVQISELTQTIESLQEALLQKDKDLSSLSGKNRGLTKLLHNKSEKVTAPLRTTVPSAESEPTPEKQPCSPKERGNNGAKRKIHTNLEEEVIDIWPDDPAFDKEKAIELRVVESVRYAYIPFRVIKKTYRQHNCLFDNKVYTVCAPRTPLMNSNYEASFTAALLQLKYSYSLPLERIVKLFKENDFDINKPTAHALIAKTALLLDGFDSVLRRAIHSDPYIRMDETYHCVINEGLNKNGKATQKEYLWSAMAHNLKLVHFFYDNGSREKEVFENYLDVSYQGAVHTDGLVCYKKIETQAYPNAIRLSCLQHAKRKFLDLENDPQAKEIVSFINQLYRIEHQILPEWDNAKKLAFRNKEAPPVLEKLKKKLLVMSADPAALPTLPLTIATNYLLNEFNAVENYLLDSSYTLDNNHIEICNRSISLNRRNSLFFGSHKGAERSALFFSLAGSCRLHRINTYEYFTDILTRMPYLPPNPSFEILREMLPDRWKKQNQEPAIESSA